MSNLNSIFEEVDNLERTHIMEIMKVLIGVDTTVPPGNSYSEYVDIILPYFEKLGFSSEKIVVPENLVSEIPEPLEGPRVNLVSNKNYGQEKDVTFYGHMDVVPAPNDGEKKWRFPPFEATMIKSGKIYGRGTSDMKGSMVCLILALEIIERLKLTPKYNISVVNCTDEEIGVWPGVRYLADNGYIKGTVFCMEGTTIPIIIIGTAGALNIVIESIGRSCHSGMNFMGINALEETVPILNELIELKKIVEVRESKNIPGFLSTEKKNLTPMFNLDIIHSGTKANIVPNLCTLLINRRVIPDENIEDVKKEITEAIERGKAKSKLLDVKVHFTYDYPPMTADFNAPNITRLKKVIMKVQNISEEEIKPFGMAGSTDMGYISEIMKTNDIIFHGVGSGGSNSHGVNETIRLKDVLIYIKELIVFLCADL